MSQRVKEMKEEWRKKYEATNKVLKKARDEKRTVLTAEEKEKFDNLFKETEELRESIEREEQAEKLALQAAAIEERRTVSPEPGGTAPAKSEEEQRKEKEAAELRAWNNFLKKGKHTPIEELRVLQADVDTTGGYLVAPQQVAAGLIQAVDERTVVRGMATVFTGINADSFGKPSLDTDIDDPTWTSELAMGSEATSMALGKRELNPHPLATYTRISNTLLRKVPSVEALVRERLAYKFAYVQENAHINGTGSGQPLGIMVASNDGISTGQDVSTGNTTTQIYYDGLVRAKFGLDDQYWPRARWLFHPDALMQIHLLQDGIGRPLLQPDVQAGAAYTILGIPVVLSRRMPNTFSASSYVGCIGDFSYYYIADSLSLQVQATDDKYIEYNETGYFARLESDGMPVLEEAFIRVQLAAS